MLAVIRTVGMFALLAILSPRVHADLWVDCENGDDANSGASPSEPFWTINAAMETICRTTVTVHVAAGVCPSENGVRLET